MIIFKVRVKYNSASMFSPLFHVWGLYQLMYLYCWILMCGETCSKAGPTAAKAEPSDRPEKGREVEYHHHT